MVYCLYSGYHGYTLLYLTPPSTSGRWLMSRSGSIKVMFLTRKYANTKNFLIFYDFIINFYNALSIWSLTINLFRRITKVRENRLSILISHIMIGLSLFMIPIPLKYIPTAVLDGLFLFVAVTPLSNNQMFERFLLLVTEQVTWYFVFTNRLPIYAFLHELFLNPPVPFIYSSIHRIHSFIHPSMYPFIHL